MHPKMRHGRGNTFGRLGVCVSQCVCLSCVQAFKFWMHWPTVQPLIWYKVCLHNIKVKVEYQGRAVKVMAIRAKLNTYTEWSAFHWMAIVTIENMCQMLSYCMLDMSKLSILPAGACEYSQYPVTVQRHIQLISAVVEAHAISCILHVSASGDFIKGWTKFWLQNSPQG